MGVYMQMRFIAAFCCAATAAVAENRPDAIVTFAFASTALTVQYGLYFAAPTAVTCGQRRYRVYDDTARMLGQTGPLAPGQGAMVRLGAGFAAGPVAVRVVALGCDAAMPDLRWVRLNKPSPDHGHPHSARSAQKNQGQTCNGQSGPGPTEGAGALAGAQPQQGQDDDG